MTVHSQCDRVISREIRAGRWQDAARIAGRSEHSLRMQYDNAYQRANMPAQGARDLPIVTFRPSVISATKISARSPLQRKRERLRYDGARSPAAPKFIETCRQRRQALGWTVREFAFHVGVTPGAVANALSPGGHLSPRMRGRIEAALTLAETAVAP
ncbi:MAG: hypothetical protein NVV72_01170 [Asticcacaulis sp.]|nr:hypothetical protein [Asticcacaulis sp.]